MSTPPYKPGKNAMSARRMNETDALARKTTRYGEGFSVTETATGRIVNLRQQPQPSGESDTTFRMLPVIVRSIRDDTDHFVKVQDVKRSDTDPWDGLMKPVGSAYSVSVWPHYKAGDFRVFLTGQNVLNRETSILPVVFMNAQPWLLQDLRFDTFKPRDQIRATDCISAFSGGR